MLKYLWQLFVVGFPERPAGPQCIHEWETIKTLEVHSYGNYCGLIYVMQCKKCGDYKKEHIDF